MIRAKLIEVIETVSLRGEGVEGDPVRHVTQYWSKDGVLLAEDDEYIRMQRAVRAVGNE